MSFDIEKTIGFALHHASYQFKTAMKATFAAKGYDVTPEEFVTLFLIPATGLEQTELVRKSLKEKTNITRLLARMVKRGWISRVEHPGSGRQQMVLLTTEGKALKKALLPLLQKRVMGALADIPEADIATTTRTLMALTERFAEPD